MPSKRKPATAELNFPKELLDELVKGPMTQGEVEAVCRSNGVSGKTVITDGGGRSASRCRGTGRAASSRCCQARAPFHGF